MTHDHLSDALNEISDKHIAEAIAPKRKKKFYRLGAVAAILAVVVLLQMMPQQGGLPLPTVHARAVSLSEGSRATASVEDFDKWSEERRQRNLTLKNAKNQLSHFFIEGTQIALTGTSDENRVYSPANLYIALAMAAEQSDGQSRQQILDYLGVSDLTALRAQVGAMWETQYLEGEYEKLALANSVWLDNSVRYDQNVMDDLSYHHYASVYQHDLQSDSAGHAIRTWLNENTGNLLEDAVDNISLNPDTLFALYSTIYFQSKWSSEFNPDSNTTELFFSEGAPFLTTYMNKKKEQMYYFWGESFGALQLSLRNGSSMWFILPDEGKTVEDVLAEGSFMELVMADYGEENWPCQKYVKVNLSVPKFDVRSQVDLKDELTALGITDVFDSTRSDLSAVSGGYLTDVNQAARVVIDENGVVAAAYTEMLCGAAAPPEEIIDFKLNRPFLFVIEKEEIPLFAGVVNAP
jgi:serpin B